MGVAITGFKGAEFTLSFGDPQERNWEPTSQKKDAHYLLSRLPSSYFARLPFMSSQSLAIAVWV